MNGKPEPKPKPKHLYKYNDTLQIKEVPACIYFYYLTPDKTGGYLVEVYYSDSGQPITDLPSEITKLVENARKESPSPQPCGWEFGDLRWRRVSYIVIAVDDPDVTLDDKAAIEFDHATPNHTFLNGGNM